MCIKMRGGGASGHGRAACAGQLRFAALGCAGIGICLNGRLFMKKACQLLISAFLCAAAASCGAHGGGALPDNPIVSDPGASVSSGGENAGEAERGADAGGAQDNAAEAPASGAGSETEPDAGNDLQQSAPPDGSAETEDDSPNVSGTESNSDDSEFDGILLIECVARIDIKGALYTAQAAGPTIEESRDNAIGEACSIPCAEQISALNLTDDEAESQIDACAETCSDEAIAIAAICYRDGASIYAEGAWSANNDPAPTNGAETSSR